MRRRRNCWKRGKTWFVVDILALAMRIDCFGVAEKRKRKMERKMERKMHDDFCPGRYVVTNSDFVF
jgi:hypothetical protein